VIHSLVALQGPRLVEYAFRQIAGSASYPTLYRRCLP